MKIKYDNIKEPKPRWKVGDAIYNADAGLYLVAEVADLDSSKTGNYLYTLIDLESGYSSESYSTIDELQRHVYDDGDMIIDGTFKYADDNK